MVNKHKQKIRWKAEPNGPGLAISLTYLNGDLTHGTMSGTYEVPASHRELLEHLRIMANRMVGMAPSSAPLLKSMLESPSLRRTELNLLPVIITKPGTYIMRNGGLAEVQAIELYRDPKGQYHRLEVTAFEAKGARYKQFRGRLRPRGFTSWHVSGRATVLNENPFDIMGPLGNGNMVNNEWVQPS